MKLSQKLQMYVVSIQTKPYPNEPKTLFWDNLYRRIHGWYLALPLGPWEGPRANQMDQFISLRSIYSSISDKEVLFDKSVIFWDNLYLPIHDFSINFAFLVILRLIMLSVYHFDPFCWIGCFIFPVIKCKLHCALYELKVLISF